MKLRQMTIIECCCKKVCKSQLFYYISFAMIFMKYLFFQIELILPFGKWFKIAFCALWKILLTGFVATIYNQPLTMALTRILLFYVSCLIVLAYARTELIYDQDNRKDLNVCKTKVTWVSIFYKLVIEFRTSQEVRSL